MRATTNSADDRSCDSCGRKDRFVAEAIGVCGSCIRERGGEVLGTALSSHARARSSFGLPEAPPSRDGIPCRLCSRECCMGPGQTSYCGLRKNDSGRLASLSTPRVGVFSDYVDPHVTNCCGAFFCPAGTGCGFPGYAHTRGPERGWANLAIFLYGCNFDCLYCQNQGHKRLERCVPRPAEELVERTLRDRKISCWCFFGGSPEPQLPFALSASRRALAAVGGSRILRICFEWNGCGHPTMVRRAAEIAYESGGNVKFDLKAWDENLSLALSGVSNRRAYENFEMVARAFPLSRDHPPSLCATTLLVPGYVDEVEVDEIARSIAAIDPGIPYSLLIFHPDFVMRDLPVTPRGQVRACYAAARRHLGNVHVGNLHLLGLRSQADLLRA